ncbi:glutamine synthetase family protein [Nocardioides bigeumensis]|uniref:Glutamine synthetase n=1 Tax=Nocardioides bigeumensis TaxID=433657 RepID=A0ABN2YD49_9ACTN
MDDLNALRHASDLPAALTSLGVTTVVIGGADTFGVMRGKRVPIGQLARILEHGMALCDVFWVMHLDESALVSRPSGHLGYFPTETNGYPDIFALPDRETLRLVPWHDDTALLLADWHHPHENGPIPIDPRHVLKRVIDRARALGYEPMSAVELEFYLLKEPTGVRHEKRSVDLVPLGDQPSTYGIVLGAQHEWIAAQIRAQMAAFDIPIEACNTETGPGQFEINLRYSDSLSAADHALLFKTGVKELAARNQLLATFMAKPHSDWAGNSAHVHISLQDTATGDPVFHDAGSSDTMSSTMRRFAAGSLATMAEFTALMAPNPNSYRRFVPYSWAATTATWGIDNRSAGLRAILEGPHGTRLEHRQGGGDVNPYLATAAVIAGGIHGIENELEPPALTDADVYAAENRSARLPSTLGEALDLLAASEVAVDWFGSDFVGHYVATKRAELEAQRLAVTDWEIARYLEPL